MYQFGTDGQSGNSQNGWQQQQSSDQHTSPTSQYPGNQTSSSAATQYQAVQYPTAQYYGTQNQQYSQYATPNQGYQGNYYQQPNQSLNTAERYQHPQSHWYGNSGQNHDANKANHNPPSESQSCYNCGNPGHWAQNCPEPRRAVPHGAMNNPRPPKRQKTTGPVITRYPPPPNYNQRGPHRGYTHPPTGQPNYSQTQPYPGMPTPVSANESTHNHWQQQSPVQQSPYSQQSGPATPWAQGGAQTPVSQFSSPLSATGNPHHSSFSAASGTQVPTEQNLKRNSHDSIGQLSRHNSQIIGSRVHGQAGSEVSDGPFGAVEQLEPWMEELQALDIPENKTGSSAIVWHPPNPVAQPLASTADEADAMGRLPIAAKLPPGMPVSRYLQNKSAEELEKSIRESPEWHEIQDDPGFAEMNTSGEVVSFVDLIARQKALATHLEDEHHLDDLVHNHETGGADVEFDGNNRNAQDASLYWQGSTSQDLKEPAYDDVDHASREQDQDQQTSSVDIPDPEGSRSGTNPKATAVGTITNPTENPVSTIDKHGSSPPERLTRWPEEVEDESRASAKQSSSKPRRENSEQLNVYTEAQEALQGFADDCFEESSPTGSPRNGCSDSAAASDTNPHATNGHAEIDRYSHSNERTRKSRSIDESPSPLRSRHHTIDNKKRTRYPSEESDGGAKRQLDDTISRVKRRQPRVAEAYGRRW